ncbi:hypothetical protein CVT24_006061 [Panaeolus cyanescens]|uniref:Copper acquisition factor BIM1-like domain-containing protein n=1 Tax=Panaeolus cyanescens TaxID=181874 RepID=A0A409YDX0_9AGAR|nr:hypothetical protein CVT24_006061 [Panaeolus cyanescens]
MFSFLHLTLSLFLASAVHAHFQLQYPPPRGVFVEDNEPKFCGKSPHSFKVMDADDESNADGYTNVTTNRTHFPLTGGAFSWNSEHPQWVSAFFISTTNATSFNDFTQVNGFMNGEGEGVVCVDLDLKSSNATGLTNGQNVTIQVLFSGGDGPLYQCADLILDDSAQQGVLGPPCTKNFTSSPAPAAPPNNTSNAVKGSQNGLVLALLGAFSAVLVML